MLIQSFFIKTKYRMIFFNLAQILGSAQAPPLCCRTLSNITPCNCPKWPQNHAPANSLGLIVGTPKHLQIIFLHTIVRDKLFYTLMCLKNCLLKQTWSKINNSGEKFCNNLSCFFLPPITPVLLSGN